ncbi:MAG: DUF523 domain-containing protein [Rhodocyclaceae bacterium]
MRSVLVSACLLGAPVRYHGQSAVLDHPVLARWLAEGRIVSLCPEVSGGLPTPRAAAEIVGAHDGAQVLRGVGNVLDAQGNRVTEAFVAGAEDAVALARRHDVALVVLKESSPSCGSHVIYDGSFSGARIPGQGVAAARLRQAGFIVFSEAELDLAEAALALAEAAEAA